MKQSIKSISGALIFLVIVLSCLQVACHGPSSDVAKLAQTFKLSYYPTKVAWHPDGKRIAVVGFSGGLSVFDIGTGQSLKTPEMWAGVDTEILYSPDGRFLSLQKSTGKKGGGLPYRSLMVMDAKDHTIIYEANAKPGIQFQVYSFDPRGRYLIATDPSSEYLMVFDMAEKKPIAHLVEESPAWKFGKINKVVYSPDGSTVIAGTMSGTLLVWSTKNWHLVKTIQAHKGYVLSMAISPDGKWLATGSNSGDSGWRLDPSTGSQIETQYDDPIKIWDMSLWVQAKALPIKDKHTTSLAFLPDSAHLVSTGGERVLFWDVQSEKQTGAIKGFSGGSALSVALSRDGEHLAVVGIGSSEVQVWDIAGH